MASAQKLLRNPGIKRETSVFFDNRIGRFLRFLGTVHSLGVKGSSVQIRPARPTKSNTYPKNQNLSAQKPLRNVFHAAMILLAVSAPAHAQSRWVDPPARYVGKYKGPVEEIVVKPHQIQWECEKLAGKNIFRRFVAKKIRIAGCQQMSEDGMTCIIVIPDKPIKGISVERIRVHEEAHCGDREEAWPAHHPR